MASPTHSRPLIAMLLSALLLSGTSAARGGGGKPVDTGDSGDTSSDGCCYGSNSKCASASESQCATYSNRLGCEWGADASCTDDDNADEPSSDGCCAGSSSRCDGVDESTCSKLSRQGCAWTYSCDGDSDGDDDDDDTAETCCLGDHAKCAVDDESSCDKFTKKFGCAWTVGEDCNAGTPSPTTLAPSAKPTMKPTSAPTGCPTNHRHRRAWAELSDADRQLYIDGYLALSKRGLTQRFAEAHLDSSEHTVPEFLPWHREFIYQMENNIRELGGEFECFTLPYWDWTDEPTPYDVEVFGESLFILNSGLGGDGQGECLSNDPVWGPEGYSPSESFAEDFPDNTGFDDCLLRDVDYTTNAQCTFFSAAQMMDLVDFTPMYAIFRPWLEGIPHALPHACFGGARFGHMATIYSPDDPLFYLLHGFVDYTWALWQDCNGYSSQDAHSYDALAYDDDVDAMLDYYPMVGFEYPISVASTLDLSAYDVSYAKGRFWKAAHVDESCSDISPSWFYDEEYAVSEAVSESGSGGVASKAVQETMYQTLEAKFAGAEMSEREKVHAWAVDGCDKNHFDRAAVEGEAVCAGGSLVDASRCDEFARDADTGDIVATLEELTEGLSECLAEQRTQWFEFITLNHWDSLYELCQGCLDDVCDRSQLLLSEDKCLFNRKVSAQRMRADGGKGRWLFSGGGEVPHSINVDTLGLMGMAGMAVAGLGMALKRMCERKEDKAMDGTAYGSMQ